MLMCALPIQAVADAPKIVQIGYQKSGFLLLVRSERTLEKRLEPLGYAVEWHEFTSGPPLLEAMNSGAIDFGHSGQPPPVFAQANGVPLVYVATTESSPDSSGLVVPQNSPIQTVADLKGKRLAFARGSSSHLFAAQLLAQAGLTFANIKPVYLQPPEARAAFQSGAVDAWAVWDPYFSAAELQLNARTLATGKGLTGFREFYFARKSIPRKPCCRNASGHPRGIARSRSACPSRLKRHGFAFGRKIGYSGGGSRALGSSYALPFPFTAHACGRC